MVTLLEKFRSQYPDGCLIADLVSLHDGQYVVRAAIIQKGETLATGLAANGDVQIAEDQARDRAIIALGIATDSPKSSHAEQIRPLTQQSQPTTSQAAASQLKATQTEVSYLEEANQPEASQPEASQPEEDLGPPIDLIAETSAETPMEIALAAKPSAATIALENFSTSSNPVDLSDVIAQTDVELARLGWTNEQGRTYLEQAYGKRSRQHLTDDELMSFLLYLEDQ
ncbi:MAG: hypothetical protein HC800_21645 [Phormidesmis sp. RL_2_1]|nr:hypothetical protein [Phormidesmis sp. RL_2_1]